MFVELKRIDALHLIERGPLFERNKLFELGSTFDCAASDLTDVAVKRVVGRAGAGWWTCDLADDSLTWTTGVYDIFGLKRSDKVTREQAVALYSEESRGVMERLRNFAVSNSRAFILDAEVRPASGGKARWMRLVAAPLSVDGQTVSLHGLKLLI